jgi:hypothetical protein
MSEEQSTNHLPPRIVELLKKRGWTWPPDAETSRKRNEAWQRLAGSIRGSRETLMEIRKEMPGRLPDFPDQE